MIKNSGAEYFASFEKKFRRNFRKFRPGIPSFSDSREILQREEYLLVQVRYARLVSGESKSRGRLKRDLERDNVLFKAKNLFLQSDRQHDALVDLLQATCKTVQNFE